MSSYPRDLIPVLREKCKASTGERALDAVRLPGDQVLGNLLDVAFNASLLTEERRRPGFRIVYMSPRDSHALEPPDSLAYPPRLLRLAEPRPYTAPEVSRLAPAADPTRMMICVKDTSSAASTPQLWIWGLLDTGENWWRFVSHRGEMGWVPPHHLTLTSSAPGELSFSVAGRVLASLESGQLSCPMASALRQGPLSDFFSNARRSLQRAVSKALRVNTVAGRKRDDDYGFASYTRFLERLLFHIRVKEHGGTLILVPPRPAVQRTLLKDALHVKYPCRYDYVWDLLTRSAVNQVEYYRLNSSLWHGRRKPTKATFREYDLTSFRMQMLDEQLGDAAEAIASLTAVDGAVIMTDRFAVMGFGGVVTLASASLAEVLVEDETPHPVFAPVDSFGTRHRSAFRLSAKSDKCLAFVVSQDGGVKAVRRVGKSVVLWPDINAGSMGL
jgi:hypothetical protein